MTARPQRAMLPAPYWQTATARNWPEYGARRSVYRAVYGQPPEIARNFGHVYDVYAVYGVSLTCVCARARNTPVFIVYIVFRGILPFKINDIHVYNICIRLYSYVYQLYDTIPIGYRVATRSASWRNGAVPGQLGRSAACTACRAPRRSLRLCVSLHVADSNSGHCGICTHPAPGHGGLAPIGRRLCDSVTWPESSEINTLRAVTGDARHVAEPARPLTEYIQNRAGSASIPPGRPLRPGTLDTRLYSQRRQNSWRISWQRRDRGRGNVTMPTRATIGAPGIGAGRREPAGWNPASGPIPRLGAANPLISSRSAPLCNAMQISAVRIAGFCDSGPKNGKIHSFRPHEPLFRSPEGR